MQQHKANGGYQPAQAPALGSQLAEAERQGERHPPPLAACKNTVSIGSQGFGLLGRGRRRQPGLSGSRPKRAPPGGQQTQAAHQPPPNNTMPLSRRLSPDSWRTLRCRISRLPGCRTCTICDKKANTDGCCIGQEGSQSTTKCPRAFPHTASVLSLTFSICSIVPPSGASFRLPAGLQGLRVRLMPLVSALHGQGTQ